MTNGGVSNVVFISYKSEERPLAVLVRDALIDWGIETWLDVDRLDAGGCWADEIDAALKSCAACVAVMTPGSISSRYVTNEWDMAIMKGKPFLPLLFKPTEPHYKYIDIQYIDFTRDHERGFDLLRSRLSKPDIATPQRRDPYEEYLQALFDRINRDLAAKIVPSLRDQEGRAKPLNLASESSHDVAAILFQRAPDAVSAVAEAGGEMRSFDDFSDAIDRYDGRVLLLGEPGAGKTITLLQHARDAVVKRRSNPSAPLPIVCNIAAWEVNQNFIEWVMKSSVVPADLEREIEHGRAFLFLDGLDELGPARKKSGGGLVNPRLEFVVGIPPNNRVIVTSRTQEYRDLGKQIELNGAVVLKPLDRTRVSKFLEHQADLASFLAEGREMERWMQSPLLLSLLAFAFDGLNEEQRQALRNIDKEPEVARDAIFGGFVRRRIEHELSRPGISDDERRLMSDLEDQLGEIAITNMRSFDKYDQSSHSSYLQSIVIGEVTADWQQKLGCDSSGFIEDHSKRVLTVVRSNIGPVIRLASRLRLLIEDSGRFSFLHLLVRDYFASKAARELLLRLDPTDIKQHSLKLVAAIEVLGDIKDRRAIPLLQKCLSAPEHWLGFGYHEAASVRSSAVDALKRITGVQ